MQNNLTKKKKVSLFWNSFYFVKPAVFHPGKKEMGKIT